MKEKKKNEWLKVKVDKVDLPGGLKLSGLEFSVYDFETLKVLKKKAEDFLESILGKGNRYW